MSELVSEQASEQARVIFMAKTSLVVFSLQQKLRGLPLITYAILHAPPFLHVIRNGNV